MKKLLLLTGILALSAVAFGGDQQTDGYAYENVLVKATVIEPLKLEKTSDVDFGYMAKGTTKDAPEKNGALTVSGASEANVKIEFASDNNFATKLNITGAEVELTEKTTKAGGVKTVIKLDGATSNDETFALTGGSKNFTLSGTADATNAASGSYEGTLYVRATYAGTPNIQ